MTQHTLRVSPTLLSAQRRAESPLLRCGLCVALLFAGVGCGERSETAATAAVPVLEASSAFPGLERVSFTLAEEDIPERSVLTMALTARGTLTFLKDPRGPKVFATVDSTGAVLARWGRRGEGPGEVLGDELLLSGDSSVVVVDLNGRRLQLFSPVGKLLREQASPPRGKPSSFANGRVLWWLSSGSGAGAREPGRLGPTRPLISWCVLGVCADTVLPASDSIVERVHRASPPGGIGGWPAMVADGDRFWLGDGYSYTIWRFDSGGNVPPVRIQRAVPQRMVTAREFAKLDSSWVKLERSGMPGPGGKRIRLEFDVERQFMKKEPLPHFQLFGLSVDGRQRLWVIGRSNDSTFLDVFADTTFLGRHMIACHRSGYAAAVRGHWLALACDDEVETGGAVDRRLYRIVEGQP